MALLAFVGILIPLLMMVALLLSIVRFGLTGAMPMLAIGLVASLLSGALSLLALRALLVQVTVASLVLRLVRQGGMRSVPWTDVEDEGGALLAETRHTLDYFDTLIKRLELEAATDELTSMLNRRGGERRLRAALDAPRGKGERLAVALLDVDGMKTVNDRWGHSAGDAALKQMASTLVRHVGDQGWVARWGGDEFLVVLVEPDEQDAAEAIMTSIAKKVAASPLSVSRTDSAQLGVSWGLAWPTPGESPANVIERADAVLYRAKQRPRNGFGPALRSGRASSVVGGPPVTSGATNGDRAALNRMHESDCDQMHGG